MSITRYVVASLVVAVLIGPLVLSAQPGLDNRPFGILDTKENPCCCKLLADLEFMGQQLGISFGPHTFLNGKPI